MQKKTTEELMSAIGQALSCKRYFFTRHASSRSRERRGVSQLEVLRILRSKTKYHEPKKDKFNDVFGSWNYSIRGWTADAEDVRIILCFVEKNMLVITVINLVE